MLSRIDAIRRADIARNARRSEPEAREAEAHTRPAQLPVPVARVERVQPRAGRSGGQAMFAAQLIGQDGAKRGLRAGAEALDRADSVYKRTEWSGSRDRRARKGAITRTDV